MGPADSFDLLCALPARGMDTDLGVEAVLAAGVEERAER